MKIDYQDTEIQKLLDAYQRLLGVRISVLNQAFIGIYRSPSQITPFCRHIRQNSIINKACKNCDQTAFQKAKTQKSTHLYKCHLGLYEAITPIIDEDKIIGYLMIGQISSDNDRDLEWDRLTRHLGATLQGDTFNLPNLKKDFFALNMRSVEDIDAMSQIMEAYAHAILKSHIIHIEKSPITDLIIEYISRYYNEELSVDRISKALNISRTTIYNHMKNEYNLSLTQYINKIRLGKAQVLLETNTDNISSVAIQVGFDNYSYFTRLFRKEFNVTPSQYRVIKSTGL